MTIRRLLWISGVLGAIAVFVPGMVVAGLYMGILPGILLMVAPTVFVYTAVFAVLRRRLPLVPGMAANAAAALLTIGLGVALALPFAAAGRHAFEAAILGDVTSGSPVRLAGDVRLERDAGVLFAGLPRKGVWECDALCAALLATPEVTSVTLAGTDQTGAALAETTFRLVPKTDAPTAGLAPRSPEEILTHLPEKPEKFDIALAQVRIAVREAAKNALIAEWALRLASEKTLIAGPTTAGSDLVIVVLDSRETGFHRIAISNVEIRDRSGTALLRRQRVTAKPIAVPIHLWPQDAMMDGGFEIGRNFHHTGPEYFEFRPVETLFLETSLARPKSPEGGVDNLYDRLAAALAQPGHPSDLALAVPWIQTLDWRQLRDADVDLLAKVIADSRMTGIEEIHSGYEKYVSPRLRPAIIARLRDQSTPPKVRNRLNRLVRAMAKGTFAVLTPEEKALLADQELRLVTDAMVERLADGGAANVPMLIEILQADVQVSAWWKRQWVMASVCRALTRLGPQAAAALPTVERLFEVKPSTPLANNWGEAQAWRVAMVRMGKPIDEVSFPAHFSPDELARDRERIRTLADKADAEEKKGTDAN